jgi:serine/threonine protein phosphatase PrpC
MKLTIGATTDPGRRPNNEDHYKIVDAERLGSRADAVLIVADGMGGRNFGEHASKAAVDVVTRLLEDRFAPDSLVISDPAHAIVAALREANDVVYALSQRDEESEGMGTTCVVAVIMNGRIYVGHAGDSRAYVIHRGRLEQLTDDHSYVAEQVRAGNLTEENARKSKMRNVITRAVGIEPTIESEVADYPVEGIDAILLCTDGLTNMLQDSEIERVLLTSVTAQACADRLIRMAKSRGGSDNITAVTAHFGDGPILTETTTPDQTPNGQVKNNAPADTPTNRASVRALSLLGVLVLLLLCSTAYLGQQLTGAGYVWQTAPPFIVKAPPPPPPPRPAVKDLSRVTYKAPVTVCPLELGPEPLVFSEGNRSLIVRGADGSIINLADNGTILYQYPWSHVVAQGSASDDSDGSNRSGNWHLATDPQGNLYVADARADTISKYRSTGELVGVISAAQGRNAAGNDLCPDCVDGLQKPEALAVDGDADIYVIDGSTLKFLKAQRVK